ncbi:hypothetical protein NBH00_11475 [Paraconexibacter antarcticus]|uniref:Uncharacterized protein n=1 Tax=Paraconexibacter antarcticus TaxID=2949664 RepID=A0ABY5DXP3_9ACTN|nr:hypothetical protein [Paraconexibacter antarcticus]UTI66801.1 hypothetical protein NBH00_11475 [Paraconexibacter antarcticus]
MLGTHNRLLAVALIAVMAVGSILMWLGIPFGWIYVVSQSQKSTQPSMGPYVLLLVAIPASMMVVGKLLGSLNRYYGRVTRTTPEVRVTLPWHRSMRGERDAGHPRTVLDVVMVVSVALAMIVFGVWFFLFAGSSLPGA